MDSVDNLITRCLTGEATPSEHSQLADWIRESKTNESRYLAFKKTLEAADKSGPSQSQREFPIDVEEEWARFVAKVSDEQPSIPSLPGTRGRRLWLRVAAAILIVVASGWMINYLLTGKSTQFATGGQTLAINLPDGTTVLLNKDSELSYDRTFGKDARIVTLRGEAFFEVEPDPGMPFVIQVDPARIEVVGTSFNVQSYSHRGELEVVVESGTVMLAVPELTQSVRLNAGERGTFKKEDRQLVSGANRDVNFLAWKTRKIRFENTNLTAVVETISRAYGVNITIEGPVAPTCSITVEFDQQSLDAVLNVLRSTLGLQYEREGDEVTIIEAGC